jgi:hypothetical protein
MQPERIRLRRLGTLPRCSILARRSAGEFVCGSRLGVWFVESEFGAPCAREGPRAIFEPAQGDMCEITPAAARTCRRRPRCECLRVSPRG